MFTPQNEYRRCDLESRFGGQRQHGIVTPKQHPLIFLYSSERGREHGYRDVWEDGVYLYSGQGHRGDMEFTRGNRAVRNHVRDGKDLHLFEKVREGWVEYVGQMVYIGYRRRQGLDTDGRSRRMIVFELVPIEDLTQTSAEVIDELLAGTVRASLMELRTKAMADVGAEGTPMERKGLVRARSQAARAYVMARADGVCEGCNEKAPFLTVKGRPFLEAHHVRRVSDGGPDDPMWMAGLCPNCHRRAHYGVDGETFNKYVGAVTLKREREIERGKRDWVQ